MQKIKNFLSAKKNVLILLAIITIGFLLRFRGLDKPGGFWFDEAYCWYEAKLSFPFGILDFLYNKDFHAPLYYFILHFWMKLFGEADLTIRLLSVLFGTLNIPVFYFIGKELKFPKGGLAAAAFAAVNSLLIYYSQEVKFYSLIALLASLSLLFVLKAVKNPSKKNFVWLAVINTAILYTYTIGFLFIAIEAAVFGVYIYTKCPKNFKNFAFSYLATALLFTPYLPVFFHHISLSSKPYVNPMQVFTFTNANFLMVIQNWFSPAISGLLNVSPRYYELLLAKANWFQIIFLIVIPVVIALSGIIRSFIKKNKMSLIVCIGILFMICEIAATYAGKFALLSRYTLLALPCFIAAAGYGLADLKNKKMSNFLIVIFIFINLIFLLFSPSSANKITRNPTFNTVAQVLKKFDVNKDDVIFMFFGGQFLNKYYPLEDNQVVPFFLMDAFVFDDKNCAKILYDDNFAEKLNRKNSYELLKSYLASPYPSKNFEKYLDTFAFKKIKKGGRFFVIVSKGIANYDPMTLKQITKDNNVYKNQQFVFMLSAKITNDAIIAAGKKLRYKSYVSSGVWDFYEFEKQ